MCTHLSSHNRYVAIDTIVTVLAVTSLFYALARPCKQYNANILHSLLFALTAFVMLLFSSVRFHHHIFTTLLLSLLCLLTPHVVLVGYVIFKVTKRIGVNYHYLYKCVLNQICVPMERSEDNCTLHDQLCPNECSPLISKK